MLRIIAIAVLLSLGVFMMGCQTLVRDKEQQIRKYSHVSDFNRRMLAEDIDYLLLLDRPSMLSSWNIRPE
jgi:hypothetical protein